MHIANQLNGNAWELYKIPPQRTLDSLVAALILGQKKMNNKTAQACLKESYTALLICIYKPHSFISVF